MSRFLPLLTTTSSKAIAFLFELSDANVQRLYLQKLKKGAAAAFTLCFNGSQANTGFAKPCISMFLLRQLWKLKRGLMMVLALFYLCSNCGLSVCSSSFVNFVALTHMSIIRKQSLTLNCKVQSSSGSKKNMLLTVAFGLSIGISTALESATSLGRYEIL